LTFANQVSLKSHRSR